MTTDPQQEQQDQPTNPLDSALGRRTFLRRAAIGAGAVAAAALVPTLGSAGGAEESMAAEQTAPTSTEPMMVYVRDAVRGEAVIMSGDLETIVVDRALVGILMRAQDRHLA